MVAASVAVVSLLLTGHVVHGQDRSASVAADVRVAAQRQEDGHVRFALRVRDGSGGWTQPVTPRGHRFDPAEASVGSWLVSSPLTLEIDDAGRHRLVRSERFEPSRGGEVELVSGLEGWAGDMRYSAYHDEQGHLVTNVSVYSASVGTPDGELRTTITCRDGETSVRIGGLPGNLSDSTPPQQISVAWSVDNGTRHRERRALTTGASGPELVERTESRLARGLLGVGSQLALAIGTTPALTANIDLAALRALPVYDNLRHCAGETVQTGHTELRIRAQVRADDRIEFAVRQRSAKGWSENILPRARVITAFGEATDWLSSTPVSVWVELNPLHAIILPDTVVRRAPEPITPVLRSGYRTTSLFFGVYTQDLEGHEPTKLTSIVAAAHERGTQLQIACLGDKRQVLLADVPSETTGDLTLTFDDTQSIASWNVTLDGELTFLSPTESDRTIQRLRQAQTLSVSFKDGGVEPISFDLTDLFETPIQANIDQCGNYASPQWQPVTDGLFVKNELGEYYRVYYPEGGDPQRHSQVRVKAVEGTPAAGADSLDLVMTCLSGEVSFGIWGLPAVGQPDSIRLRVDSGEWFAHPVQAFVNPDGTASVEFGTILGRLRQGRSLKFEHGLEEPAQGAFDLTSLFGTPIQTNFDNCGRAYWSSARTYVPVVAEEEQSSRHLRYWALEKEDGTVSTTVQLTTVAVPADERAALLRAHCLNSSGLQLDLVLPKTVEAGEVEVTLTIDDRPADASIWIAEPVGMSGFLHPPSNAQLMAQLHNASVLTVEAPELLAVPLTFHVSGMFETPVQRNLDECGYYKPGDVRTLPLPLNAYVRQDSYDAERDLWVTRFWERSPGRITPSTTTLEQHHRQDRLLIGLETYCGSYGIRLTVYGSILGVLQGDRVQVEWSTDGTTTQRATWNLAHGAASSSISPLRAQAVLAIWRQASELELRLPGVSADTYHFDLEAMFGIPIVDTFDDCLAAPFPVRTPPVTGIPRTVSGELTFMADVLNGSTWVVTHLGVRDNGEAPTQPEAIDTRSSLNIGCGSGGLDIWIADLDVAESTFISGDSVDVTWTIDGRSRSETWNAWTQSFDYATSPRDDLVFYEALKGASTLTIRVESDPPISKTYELAKHNFWDTPVQPNLDACGG